MTHFEPKKTNPPQLARLIPVDKQPERKTVSAFLATIMSVDEFGKGLLRGIGAKCTKTSKIECFTEVIFPSKDNRRKMADSDRPDGLIVITTAGRTWKALVEAKVGKDKQKPEQINSYLDIARDNGIDAVITISNQFVADAKNQPDSIRGGVDGRKTRSVEVFHWSWAFLLNEAQVWLKDHLDEKKNIDDPEQKYILKELVRFFGHESSGVSVGYENMGRDWKTTCEAIQKRVPINSVKDEVGDAVSSWHKLVRGLSLQMGTALGENVTVVISRKHKTAPQTRLSDNIKRLIDKHQLKADFDIPHMRVASPIRVEVDVNAAQVRLLMKVKANFGRPTAKGRINDFLKQIPKVDGNETLHIRSVMPRKADNKEASMREIIEDGPERLYSDNKVAPKEFAVIKIIDVGKAAFNSSRNKFPALMIRELNSYYEKVGRHLDDWKEAPPRSKPNSVIDDSDTSEIIAANDEDGDTQGILDKRGE